MEDSMELPVSRLAELAGVDVKGEAGKMIRCAAPFDQADEHAVTFADNKTLLKRIAECRAGAIVVPRSFEGTSGEGTSEATLLTADNPRLVFARIMDILHPRRTSLAGISPRAAVGREFVCGADVAIGPGAFIGEGVTIGSRTIIHPNAYIGDGVSIGEDTKIFPNATVLERCRIGDRVIVHSGTVIGSDGYGFVPDGEKHLKIPQIGIVQVDDDVEIGACSTVDRATFGTTWIQEGVKTDDHVHIGHNCTVGAHSIIVAQVGVAGSVTIGRHVTLAGQAGLAGHLSIGDGAVIGPRAGVTRSVPPGQVVSGTPEMPHRQWLRVQQVIPRLPELKKKISELEKRLEEIEEKKP